MGKISAKENVSNCTSWEELMRYTYQFLSDCKNQINGNLTFSDNLSVKFIDVVFPSANMGTPIPHGLGRSPIMTIAGTPSASAIIYQTQNADQNNVYLAASAACSVRILVI